jgi:ATP-binding cassette subfamily F protein uup
LVIEVENATVGYGGAPVIRDFSTRIMRGDRIGIIGPNGAGKTTLLKLLLGELAPQQGSVHLGTKLEIAYFDQQRAQLDPGKSVMDNLNYGSEVVTVNGSQRHVMSYLQDFLFPPQRVRSPVSSLSGGERNRLLLARLFIQPANLLVMDEPTNDLDVETLELLEELLSEYPGTLLLVSHDRVFLDNVVTSTLVFEGGGRVQEYVGGYEDWQRQSKAQRQSQAMSSPAATMLPTTLTTASAAKKEAASSQVSNNKKSAARKLSYKEQRELESLPVRIETLESEQAELQQQVNSGEFYRLEKELINQTLTRLETVNQELEAAYERWTVLEEQSSL